MNNWTVYIHITPNNKYYVGVTSNEVYDRWKNGLGYKRQIFYRAIEKYKWENIKHQIFLTNLTQAEANDWEIFLISTLKSNQSEYGYNIANGGNTKGKHSEETKEKIKQSNTGKKFSENHKKRISDSKKGSTSPNLGKKMSEEQKKKVSESRTGKGYKSPNTKKVICENIIFESTTDCAKFYNISRDTLRCWLDGINGMPQEWIDKGLSYFGEEKNYKPKAKGKIRIECEGRIFDSIKECANFYNIKYGTMKCWLNGKNKMPIEWEKKGLCKK